MIGSYVSWSIATGQEISYLEKRDYRMDKIVGEDGEVETNPLGVSVSG